MNELPSLSTDQVAAFVALARTGSIRAAAEGLHLTEQGVRNRLVTLEQRLNRELYRKQRGVRRMSPLTADGRRFLPRAIAFLRDAEQLAGFFHEAPAVHEVNVVASQYLIAYLLIDAVRQFHRKFPHIRVRLQSRREADVEQTLLEDPHIDVGVAAPYEGRVDLLFEPLFAMPWSLIVPRGHALAGESCDR